MPETAKRIRPSLQYFSKFVEYIDGNLTFDVNSNIVERSLEAQQERYFKRMADTELSDPHANLPTDVIGDEDHEKALGEIFTHNYPNWKDLAVSWTLCTQTYIRNHSARVLLLGDLRTDSSHGPEVGGANKNILTMILRMGRHKVKKDKIKVVGAWRHRNYLRCSTGMVAMSMMTRLYFCRDIDFRMAHGSSKWQKIPLISGWKDQKAADKAYRALLMATNISWSKVTHLRKAGMEQSSARGDLTSEEQATMSKHSTQKNFRYASELYAPVMHVMAGFSRASEYRVPRINLEPPPDWGDITRCVFPQIDIWKMQANAPDGDKTRAAQNFLGETLPFLARVVVQDGIYWLRDFPDHEISRQLRHIFPPSYEQWALEKRQALEQEVQNEGASQILNLNCAAQASYNQLRDQLTARTTNIEQQLQQLATQQQEMFDMIKSLMTMKATMPSGGTAIAVVPQPKPLRQVAQLRSTEYVPPIPTKMPESMAQLLVEHEQLYMLTRYEHYQQRRHWPQAVKLSYGRRTYLYQELCDRAKRQRNTMEESRRKEVEAQRMDNEMQSLNFATTSRYLKFLKEKDPKLKKRGTR